MLMLLREGNAKHISSSFCGGVEKWVMGDIIILIFNLIITLAGGYDTVGSLNEAGFGNFITLAVSHEKVLSNMRKMSRFR